MENSAKQFSNDIINGAGWATESYVMNFAPKNLTVNDRIDVMTDLCNRGRLHAEEKLSEETLCGDIEPGDDSLMSHADVARYMFGLESDNNEGFEATQEINN